MPKNPNELYSVYKTTVWFAIASIALTVFLYLMVMEDYSREWKVWQKEFVELDREMVVHQLEEAHKNVDAKKVEALKSDLVLAEEALASKHAEVEALKANKTGLNLELLKTKTRSQNLKQHYDSYKFYYEEHDEHGEKIEAEFYGKKLKELEPQLSEAKLEQERIEAELEAKDADLLRFTERTAQLEGEIEKLLQEQQRLEKALKHLEPSLVKDALNAPMIDFIQPTLQVQQVVLEHLEEDFYFAKAQRVDRCTTCHLAIDRKGFEDAPQPFTTHSNMDLFLAADSPHPLEKIGCTTCHGGSGRSMGFTWAAHTPRNQEQAEEWKKKYHWRELHKWKEKMLPLQHVQASCTQCHQGVVNIPGAPKLNEGRALAQASGCFGCHAVKGFEDRWKVGPDLGNVRSKLDREWIVRWLQNPKAFRASTKMPRVFHLENTSSDEDKKKSNAAIEGIATYLLKNSDTIELTAPPQKGDPEIGKGLVKELGCLGCHSADDAQVNDHGPELIHFGSKVNADWLYTWLKNPKHYAPDTRMPNLRLGDDEASHITAYLLQDRNEAFEAMPLPQVDESDVDELVIDFLTRTMRRSQAEEKLSSLGLEEKFEMVGHRMLRQQGCFGCHAIQGFEEEKPIGTELTKEGQKELDKFDFGFVHDIEHSRQGWLFQKLKEPRSFDRGKVKMYHEKLRMPDFGFTDEQAEALVTFLLSSREIDIPLEMQRMLNLKEAEIEAGRVLVSKFNCQGCHTLDDVEGRIRSLYDDLGKAPPVIEGEGAKIQETWLFHFLKHPSLIRPWLKIRMPIFDFSDEEADALVKYFSNLDDQKISFAREKVEATKQELSIGRDLFTQLKCIQCHQPGEAQALSASFLAPNLVITKDRLKPAWVIEWLKDPQELQAGTMMPGFFPDGETPIPDKLDGDASKQIKAIRDYLWHFTEEEEQIVTGKKTITNKEQAPASVPSEPVAAHGGVV
jgi:mono/diheme cytochrome c family protein